MAPTGMFSFSSQTGPSSDHISGSSWDTTGEGSQNFQDFLDTGSAHQGEAETFSFHLDGHITPRVQAPQAVAAPIGGEPMRRGLSRTSTGSHKHRITKPSSKTRMTAPSSQMSSRMSNMDITGNSSVFTPGTQPGAHLMDVNSSCLFLDSDASGVSSHMLYSGSGMSLDLGMGPDGLPSPPTEVSLQHVIPTHIQLDHDASLTSHSPSGSWATFSPSESHMSGPSSEGSPAHWALPEPLASPPRSENGSPAIQAQLRLDGQYHGQDMLSDDMSATVMPMGDDFALPPSYTARRPVNEGESARDHPLYKNASPGPDGLFHCPWEGQASCNHKAEKLKCNYDKFVDSHLKPYRCKDTSCENARFSSTACLLRHEREAHAMHGHGDKPFLCSYDGCDRALPGNGFPRQWNLRDHMRRVHNDSRIPGSPTSSTTGHTQQAAKSRKRKDAPKVIPAVSRKNSAKPSVVAAAVQEQEAPRPLIEEWIAQQKALESIVQGLAQPDNVAIAHLIKDAQGHLNTMGKLASTMSQGQTVQTVRRTYNNTG
ncbi:conserved hypothetical protein [Verticillium alfalfae VaMs.102]|uniref:C2H2-type domain-containing protein n=1 Tax=Verticillium alfalfae (strain VaMs.102 / ATCC MYA-4576 / FGSC 10136) TaxID=526221 RepID=C9SPY7_VERA1|nr:conserved hypothetical protein [Verticillium alfalfae VaMs.102]EEY20912.1 conserved hypothetical protein [Verticillium alfalfae VaMs.102]